MNPSPATIGMVMIGFALIVPALSLRSGGEPLGIGNTFAAAFLLIGGAALLVRRPVSFWIGLGGALVALVSAVAGLLLHRMVGLPIDPRFALVIGIYACLRVLIARSGLNPPAPRRSIADELARDLGTDRGSPAPGDDGDPPAGSAK